MKIQTMASISGNQGEIGLRASSCFYLFLVNLTYDQTLARPNVESITKAALRYHESVRMHVIDKL